MNVRGIREKRLSSLSKKRAFSLDEKLKFIFLNHPVMDIYISDSEIPIRVDGMRFNYNCLGENNKKSVTLNFRFMINLIKQYPSETIIDTGFGENTLPFLDSLEKLSGENIYRNLTLYSFFIHLAYKNNIYNTKEDNKKNNANIPMFQEFTGLIWGGPLNLSNDKIAKTNSNIEKKDMHDNKVDTLPFPPKKALKFKSNQIIGMFNGIILSFKKYKRFIRQLGPPILFYSLSLLSIGLFILANILDKYHSFFTGVILIGLILFIHSFVLLKRKRTIENCPTSKIRSMPMGEVEVNGNARQKYYLKSPFTNIDCVYYSYKVYEIERYGDKTQRLLKEWGDSETIPFYLEDDTGKVLIYPENAILRAGTTQKISGNFLDTFMASPSIYKSDNMVINEKVIPAAQSLYVTGYAHPLRMSSKEKKKELVNMIRELKRDQNRLKKYDINNDGKIDAEEWEQARRDIEEKIIIEGYGGDKDDNIAIAEHPTGGLFYISDKHEKGLITSLNWRIPLFFLLGIVCITIGIAYLLRIFF